MSQFAEDVRHDIEQFGCSVIYVADDQPPFAYTVGLWLKHKHPELIIFGLDDELMGSILMRLAGMVQDGARYSAATHVPNVGGRFGVEVAPLSGAHLDRYFGFALGFYEEPFEIAQVVWPDSAGRFPGDPMYDRGYEPWQPTLKRRSS